MTSDQDGATLQLQNYIRSVDDSDLNFLQDSMLLSQSRPPVINQAMLKQTKPNSMEQSTNEAADLMFGETDRFLEEVLLSRGPKHFGAHDPHTKNDFFPKKQANVLPVVGEMSIQDLSSHDIT